jgi:tRNA (mo5U34)-methyltransferase
MNSANELALEYFEQVAEFEQRAARLGLGDVRGYYWYHTVDLGDGLVTPGMHDYRATLAAFRFPESMRGMKVLDVGSATGFFAFEFERRGAQVVSVELPSLEALDRFPGQTTEQVVAKIGKMLASCRPDASPAASSCSAADLYFALLEGPFQFCKHRLNSRVERCYSTVYDISREELGGREFDLVFVGDVLVHTLYPLRALAALAPLCKGTLVLSQHMPEEPREPAMLYVGGERPGDDDLSWWLPNRACMEQMLQKLGFRTVEEVGRNIGVLRPAGHPFDRAILHASR